MYVAQTQLTEFLCERFESNMRRVVDEVWLAVACLLHHTSVPCRYRMIFEARPGYRRRFRPSDIQHPDRNGAKEKPNRSESSSDLDSNLDWYEREFSAAGSCLEKDPILSLEASVMRFG